MEFTKTIEKPFEIKEAKQVTEEKNTPELHFPVPCVYCGPSVRGVARQYTTYTVKVPKALEEWIAQHPAARGLLIPVSKFAQTRRNLETLGTQEAALYQKIKTELSKLQN